MEFVYKTLRRLWQFLTLDFGRSIDDLSEWIDVPRQTLISTPRTYQVFEIPKRSGGKRSIAAPSPQLKKLQRRLLKRLLTGLNSHPASFGNERGRSIVENAQPHVRATVIVKLDIVSFFSSIPSSRVYGMFRRCGWNHAASKLLTELTTYRGVLPQGAPTSPRLSNLVSVHLDKRLSAIAKGYGATYTRYVDDLTFSSQHDSGIDVQSLIEEVRQNLGMLGFTMHYRKKLSIHRPHQQQLVTGLVVNEKVQIPRRTRRKLRAIRHRIKNGQQATLTPEQLKGWEAYELMIGQRLASAQGAPEALS